MKPTALRALRLPMILGALLVSLPAMAGGAIRVVSDIDDTAKISNAQSVPALLLNSLFSDRAFSGMKELYSSFAYERSYEFDYLSAAPFFWKPVIGDFLWDNGFPKGDVHVRSPFKSESRIDFKKRVLKELLVRYPDDSFIYVGDDGQQDVQAYDEIYRFAAGRILAIYIRKIANKPLPPSEYPFLTSFDIARTENMMGRLDTFETAPVALAVISEQRDQRLIPRFSYCPAKKPYRFSDPKVEEWNDRVSKRVQDICKKRRYPDEIL
jgi:hypothetical protein